MSEEIAAPATQRTPKGKQRVQELVAVAAELFLERGFRTVAVDDIIARAGGSRRNVYDRFGGKEGLFTEVVQQLCADMAARLEQVQLQIDDIEPRAALAAFGRQILQGTLHPRTLALHRLMIAEGKRFPALSQSLLHAGHLRVVAILAPWIAARQHLFANPHLPAERIANQFIVLVVTEARLRMLTGLDPEPPTAASIDAIVDEAVTALLGRERAIA